MLFKYTIISAILIFGTSMAFGQPFVSDLMRDSARSDKLTGGRMARSTLVPGDGDIKITINVPSFQMTLWQSGREIRTYPVGVGMVEYPIFIGRLKAYSVEWNPVWIPPSSDWIEASSKVKPGEVILPTDPRNPLGKLKIPLGYGYLIHQAKGPADMGSLVSHGCVRVMKSDLYDLAEKIVAARGLAVSPDEIAKAKRTKKTLVEELQSPIPVEITYDTIVVESGRLHIYPDVYDNRKNTVENVRAELRSSKVDDSKLRDAEIKRILSGVKGRNQFQVSIAAIGSGTALKQGRYVPVVGAPAAPAVSTRRVVRRKG
jgi:hypothetical protein